MAENQKIKVKKPIYKKWWFWVLIVFIGVGIFGGGDNEKDSPKAEVASKQDKENNKKEVSAEEDPKEEAKEIIEEIEEEVIYQIGDSFESGKLGVAVEAVEEKTSFTSTNQFVSDVTTEGKFIAVTAKLTNNDKESRTFSSTQFKIIDDQGREFGTLTSMDLMLILGDKDMFLESCNPGMSRTGIFVFEVPEDLESYSLKVGSGVGFASKTSETVKLK